MQNQKVLLVQIQNISPVIHIDAYLSVDPIYGYSNVHYSSSFLTSYIINEYLILKRHLSNYKWQKMDDEVNIIQVSCSSPSRLNIVVFALTKANNFLFSIF